MRTFVALKIPVEQKLKTLLLDIKQDLLTEKIKWVDFSTLHLTLFFLGETKSETVVELMDVFQNRLSKVQQFSLNLKGMGVFGSELNPKVIWIGVSHSDQLIGLHKLVNVAIAPLGFTPDPRGFNPHITIGRVKQVNEVELLNELIDENKHELFQESIIDRITLYKSELTSRGPIYTQVINQEFK
jgi:2'-5' RNA ligase